MHNATLIAASIALAAQSSAVVHDAKGRQCTTVPHCVVAVIDDVQLPAQEHGILIELSTKEGMVVTKNQILGRIDDTDATTKKTAARYRLDVAHEKATNDAEVRLANKVIELTDTEHKEAMAINERSPGSIPQQEVRRKRIYQEKACLDAEVAQMNFNISGLECKVSRVELKAAKNELERRILRAPFDGVVVQLLRQQSEWVQPGESVLRVVRMDRLRIEGFVNSERHAPERVLGAAVTIKLKLAGDDLETLTGKVDYVSPLVEANGDYRIWAEVENRRGRGGYHWLLRPGSEAEMLIELNSPDASQ